MGLRNPPLLRMMIKEADSSAVYAGLSATHIAMAGMPADVTRVHAHFKVA